MRVALIEHDTVWEDPAANRARIPALLPAGADVAVLPELAFSGFTMRPEPDADAEPFLRDVARAAGSWLVAGYCAPGPANAAAAVSRDGHVVARYEKLHPFAYAGEHEHYVRGGRLPVFELEGFTAAMLICYDLRFPEAFRDAALRGANLFFVLANWPERRIEHWKVLLRARAIENQAYVVGVNRVGADPNERYPGASTAVEPLGEVIHEGHGVAELDPERPRWLRGRFPALRDVRGDRYRLVREPGSDRSGQG